MTTNQKLYSRALLRAFIIEVSVMAIWIYPLATAAMTHSAAAAAQTPLIVQLLGFLGLIFHLPSLVFVLIFPPLVPIAQTFIMSGIIYCKWKFIDVDYESSPTEKYKYIK